MDERFNEAGYAIQKAREALRRGDRGEARKMAEHAASLTPQSEDPWLILAAVASPQASVNYIKKALDINPNSPRAHTAMQWAMKRLQGTPGESESFDNGGQARAAARGGRGRQRRSPFYPLLFFMLGCMALVFAAWSVSPALASIVSFQTQKQAVTVQHPQSWAVAEIAKPTYTPTSMPVEYAAVVPTSTPFLQASVPDFPVPTAEEILNDPVADAATPEENTTGTIYAEIVPDTPTPDYVPPTSAPDVASAPYVPPAAGNGGARWIDVNLSQQRVYAYEGDTVVNSFLVSTGTWQTPTVTGKYKIWIKLRYTDMSGPGYYLPNVPYTMYFYKGYGLHGTYWHNNFGTPMSHGCVNLSIPDAAWLYDFASVGTTVNVHY